jgi:PAS domain S-box-containing protein
MTAVPYAQIGHIDMIDAVSASDVELNAVIGTSRSGRISFWPECAAEFYRIPPSDALGRDIFELLEWDESVQNRALYPQLGFGDVWTFNHSIDRAAPRSLRTSVSAAVDPRGVEELLFYSAPTDAPPSATRLPRYAALGDDAELSARCSRRMVIECTSAAVPAVFRYAHRDIIGATSLSFVHPDDRRRWEQAWNEALRHPGDSSAVEVRRRTADGDWRIVSSRLVNHLTDPDVSAVIVNSRDVTALRSAQSSSESIQQTLTSVLQSMGRGIWVLDESGSTVFANAAMIELLGMDRPDLSGYSIHDLWDRALSSVPEQRTPGMRSDYEVPLAQPDGTTRWLRFTAVPRHSDSGDYLGSLLICADVSESHRPGHSANRIGLFEDGPRQRAEPAGPIISEATLGELLSSYLLTQREFDIVYRLIRGDRVPAIASTLFVSQSTVRNQLAAVFRKVGVHSQQELIAQLRRSWQ